jgi:hypothetical protein
MIHRSNPFRRLSGWRRQIALAVLFALQGAITLAPLLEQSEKGRMGAHAEERGAQHKYQHDDRTCAVCSVRSLHASPAQNCPAIECERQQTVAALDAPVNITRRVALTALPRAPPQLN